MSKSGWGIKNGNATFYDGKKEFEHTFVCGHREIIPRLVRGDQEYLPVDICPVCKNAGLTIDSVIKARKYLHECGLELPRVPLEPAQYRDLYQIIIPLLEKL